MDTQKAADRAVERLVADISDRHGLKQEWHQIDQDVKDEICAEWKQVILEAIQALEGENARLKREAEEWAVTVDRVSRERDDLNAENARLKEDYLVLAHQYSALNAQAGQDEARFKEENARLSRVESEYKEVRERIRATLARCRVREANRIDEEVEFLANRYLLPTEKLPTQVLLLKENARLTERVAELELSNARLLGKECCPTCGHEMREHIVEEVAPHPDGARCQRIGCPCRRAQTPPKG